MTIKNTEKVSKIKKIFFLVSILIALGILALFLLNHVMYALAGLGIFSMWYLYFHVADYQYIEYSDDADKIILRYYKVISFTGKAYNSIEFPQYRLRKALFENSFFGNLSDLTLVIKTDRGIAEYPTVSLAGLNIEDRKRIQESLNSILKT
ncbi:hypothetical protein SAMN05444285_11887 [Draconibacterium orientale]|uniref:PH domain-containing protein n=1 Tax=Draconibacterium orientale TaxID=1168034 RepID=X5DMX1_9BACT|nr:hypothetical protein [Draconibacterium orientale]AHW61952.1 hypothetical protein FH5T_11725 [Draconibacterium orientale]SET64248.1 hypothetical protein SAMN05444285_11887 [Draconibacterium orientale]